MRVAIARAARWRRKEDLPEPMNYLKVLKIASDPPEYNAYRFKTFGDLLTNQVLTDLMFRRIVDM
jgi:hypothetical protein